ncbi:hypothetical protein [Streptomyces sp. NPDC048560]|uniref:hypothetical protein n=1 Tax=Streptomyces sp. NPDC048560 TaxID=3155488 RepID=UPI003430332F
MSGSAREAVTATGSTFVAGTWAWEGCEEAERTSAVRRLHHLRDGGGYGRGGRPNGRPVTGAWREPVTCARWGHDHSAGGPGTRGDVALAALGPHHAARQQSLVP